MQELQSVGGRGLAANIASYQTAVKMEVEIKQKC